MDKKNILSYFFIFTIALIFYQASIKPLYNWDMIPYMAAALSIEQNDFQKTHDNVYCLIKEELPDTVFNKLTSGVYRESTYKNYKIFREQTLLYVNRPLYILFIYILYKTGIDLIVSTFLISIISAFLTTVLLYFWLLKFYDIKYSFILTVILIFSTGLREAAKYSTPDSLSVFLIISAIYLIANQKSKNFMIILLLLSQLSRPDNFVLIIVLSIFLYTTALSDFRINKDQFYTVFISSILLLLPNLINSVLKSFFSQLYLGSQPSGYFHFLLSSVKILFTNPFFGLYLLLSSLIYLTSPGIKKEVKMIRNLLSVVIITITIRFFVFPSAEIRFYSGYFILIAIFFLICFSMLVPANPKSIDIKQIRYFDHESK